MNIKIPKQIETNYININELIIEFVDVRNYEVPLNSLQIAVVDKVYNDCSKIIFHIDYKTSEQKTIEFEKHEVLFATKLGNVTAEQVAGDNKRMWYVADLLTPSMISEQMFNPRYFSTQLRENGTTGSFGITTSWLNAQSGSVISKGIFQNGYVSDHLTGTYRMFQNNLSSTDPPTDFNNTPLDSSYISSLWHGVGKVFHSHYITMKNNYNNPCVVTCYEIQPKIDYDSFVDASEALDLMNEIKELWHQSFALYTF